MSYLDSPSTTSSTTYNVYVATEAAASVYVNRTSADTDNDGAGARGSSTITVFEVLA